jgi:hypothetical protein
MAIDVTRTVGRRTPAAASTWSSCEAVKSLALVGGTSASVGWSVSAEAAEAATAGWARAGADQTSQPASNSVASASHARVASIRCVAVVCFIVDSLARRPSGRDAF